MAGNQAIRAVIFDFGSVLVLMGDEEPRQALAAELGVGLKELNRLVFDSPSAVKAMIGELTIDQHWQAVGEALGVPFSEMPDIMGRFWSADVVNQELVRLIEELRKGYKIGLLSNAWGDLRQVLTGRIPISHLFDDMVISAEVGMGKPDPRIFRMAVDRLGVQAEEAVFIDDMLANVEAARGIGLNAIHFQNNLQLLAELRNYNINVEWVD